MVFLFVLEKDNSTVWEKQCKEVCVTGNSSNYHGKKEEEEEEEEKRSSVTQNNYMHLGVVL